MVLTLLLVAGRNLVLLNTKVQLAFFKPCLLSILCFSFSLFHTSLATATKLQVVTEHFPPFQILDENKQIRGISVDIMRRVLDTSGVDYEIVVQPWARAFNTALNTPDVIIFSMVRNQEREDKFIWLGELQRADYHLYGLKSRFNKPFSSIDDAKQFVAVASRESYEAKELIRLGFEVGKNLILTVNFDDYWPMIEKDRAQMTLTLKKLTSHKQDVISLWPIAEDISLWAAASKGTDQKIIDTLVAALNSTLYSYQQPRDCSDCAQNKD